MAWRSSGTTNDEMVDNLKRFSVISSPIVERGFRSVDRRFFVPKEREDIAHADQPLKERNIHISAPHIYGSALEALELKENSSLSFLNIGSGTGYMSCIVASILGSYSTNYGIDIHQEVVEHCNASIARWKSSFRGRLPYMQMIHGDALNITLNDGEALIGFDRIYIGASVNPNYLSKLRALLKTGGVLVGPVGDELVKIVRVKCSSNDGKNSNDFSHRVLSGVRFTALLEVHSTKTLLPSRVWSPSVHQTYPEAFRRSANELLLCSHASIVQPIPTPRRHGLNMAATLPRVLWLEILSFTQHNWFEPPQSEEGMLRQRLSEEHENSRKAHAARIEAEARCHLAERERDVYRLLARRWQSRLLLLQQRNNNDDNVGDEMLAIHGRESNAIFGLRTMLRGGFQSENGEDDSFSDTSDDEDEEGGHEMDVEETNEDGQDEAALEPGDDDEEEEIYISSDEEVEEEEDMSLTRRPPTASFVKRQVRTVSVSDDF